MSKDQHPEQDPAEGSRAVVEKELKRGSAKTAPERDAAGQSEGNHKGGSNDGVASASPRLLSGRKDGDATFFKAERR